MKLPSATFRTLSHEQLRANIDAFLRIASDVDGEYWAAEHFLRDLPEKWRLSFAAWSAGRPIAYAILSRKGPDHIHLHHLMVEPNQRGRGLGQCMLTEMERRVSRAAATRLTLKVDRGNERAQRFYRRAHYIEQGRDGAYLVFGKNCRTLSARGNAI